MTNRIQAPALNFQTPQQPQGIPGMNFPQGNAFGNTQFLSSPVTQLESPFSANQPNTLTPEGVSPIPGSGIPGGVDIPGGGPNVGFFDAKGGSRFLIPGLEALTGVGNAYLAKQQLDLGRDQFSFAKDTNIRDFNSQADVYNTRLENARSRKMAAEGSKYDTSTADGKKKFDDALEAYVQENSIQSAY